ncbi:MAG: type II toxin-antitoxin system HicB family antitoxin [Treponema sp.]|nr:type II toxin-antitoxin system HicB family antitoxin [Treponema sp.]
MKNNRNGSYLHYKDYIGNVCFSEEDAVFHGKVVGIKALISFEGDSVKAITDDFHKAIDEYLDFCDAKGKQPEKPFKGSFNVRINADLHRRLVLTASARGISLNTLVENAIRQTV